MHFNKTNVFVVSWTLQHKNVVCCIFQLPEKKYLKEQTAQFPFDLVNPDTMGPYLPH